ncbi:MAG TPA: trypsin-like peptidase domain-containing protein [Gemmataceae bacterium]|nr:trypsin-like peptidase domain-containing protein [Gemmataceae bacterium]
MAVTVVCPGCRTGYPISDDLVGKKIRCKKCQETFTATPSKNRATDDRIQTKPGAVKAGRRNDDGPRGRPETKKAGKGLLIGVIAGAIVLIVGGGIGALALMFSSDTTTDNQQANVQASNPPVVTPATNPTNGSPKTEVAKSDTKANEKAATPTTAATFSTLPTEQNPAQPRIRYADFRADVVNRAKESAVMIQTTMAEGAADGSGFIAEPDGIIITNAHVVGMKHAAARPPDKVDVIVHAGIKDKERRLEAKILALDREEDLAVLKVNPKDLPPPIPMATSHDVPDGAKLMTLGFPLGRGLKRAVDAGSEQETGLEVKARYTTVSGRHRAPDGSVKFISVEGGVDGGNSGGAVIDTSGYVVAIVDAEIPGTQIKFVIPVEYARYLLQGRIQRLIPGQAVASGGGAKQPLTAIVADPMKRIAKITADIWTAPKPTRAKGELAMRPGADREPPAVAGDSNKISAPVRFNPDERVQLGEMHLAHMDLTLPPLPAGHVYWFRPKYQMKDGREHWGEAVVVEMGRHPVDLSPANLTVHHKADTERRIHMVSRATSGYETEETSRATDLKLIASISEKTRSPIAANGDAKIRMQYEDLKFADRDLDDAIRRELKGVMDQVKGLGAEVTMTPSGNIRSVTPDFAQVSRAPLVRAILDRLNKQIVQALENVAVPLPNKEVQPGEGWNVDTQYTLLITQPPRNATFKMMCKYVGTRVRNGRKEAVIEMTGRVIRGGMNDGGNNRGAPGQPPAGGGSGNVESDEGGRSGFQGLANGSALVDLETGYITLSRLNSDVAFEVQINDKLKVTVGLVLETTLTRSLNKTEPKEPTQDELDALLANQPKRYKPMIGSVGVDQGGGFVPPPSTDDARTADIKPDVAERVKKKTVFIEVERDDGGGSGSGWLAEPDGIIVTNSHVVGMKDKAKRPPTSIKVTFDSGLPTARSFPAKLLSLDRAEDLAVLKVDAPNLPEPFKIVPSADMVEGHALSVVGFPYGKSLSRGAVSLGAVDLSTEVKVRSTHMSGRFTQTDGSPKWIQVEGGASPGNSGGPVVDSQGNVRAILVAGFPGRQIVFTIPSEYAARMLQGYPMEVKPGIPYLDSSTARQPIEINFADPLKRVRKVAIDFWVGAPGKPRRAPDGAPKQEENDGSRQTFDLTYDPASQSAKGEFTLPPLPQGQVYWLQPRFTNGTGKEQWYRATTYSPDGPPVERRPVELALKHRTGMKREVELTALSHYRYNLLGTEHVRGDPIKISLSETTLRVGQNKSAQVQIQYEDLELDWNKIFPGIREQAPSLESNLRQTLRPILALIRGVAMVVTVSKDGHMTLPRNGLSYGRIPLPVQPLMATFNDQIFSALQALTFPLPGKVVPYGHAWTFDTNLFVPTRKRSEAGLFKMNFKYLGVRDRGGREEAVVEFHGALTQDAGKSIDIASTDPAADKDADAKAKDGKAAPKAGGPANRAPKGVYGEAHGVAYVDVASGTVTSVKLDVDLDVEMLVPDPDNTKKDVPAQAGGRMELALKRTIVAQGR